MTGVTPPGENLHRGKRFEPNIGSPPSHVAINKLPLTDDDSSRVPVVRVAPDHMSDLMRRLEKYMTDNPGVLTVITNLTDEKPWLARVTFMSTPTAPERSYGESLEKALEGLLWQLGV